MFVEIHLIQNFAPSNLNRDDTNSPKDCTFGGVRRARISSQCFKRAIREEDNFKTRVGERIATRTRLVNQRLVDILVKEYGREAESAALCVRRALEAVGFKWDSDKDRSSVLLFVSEAEFGSWAHVINEHWDSLDVSVEAESEAAGKRTSKQDKKAKKDAIPADVLKAIKLVMRSHKDHAVDVALFGRMVAENTDLNVDAACQVAHAISTHAAAIEMDFFTAVDDLQPKEETGAGMMGVVEYNSACFYRYAQVNLNQLASNLGGTGSLVGDAVVAFCDAAIRAIPSGKQNSFAAQNRPDWIRIEVRKDGSPRSLVNAFARPVQTRTGAKGLIESSVEAATQYLDTVDSMYGDAEPIYVATASTCDVAGKVNVNRMLADLQAAVDGEFA